MTSRFQFMHGILCKYRTQLYAEWWATAYAYKYLQRLNIPAQGNGKGADTEEMLSAASQLWRWAVELSSGCWDVEQKLIWQKLGYSWVLWERGKELAPSSSISDTAAVAVSLSQGSLWTKWRSRQSNSATCKAGATAICGRKEEQRIDYSFSSDWAVGIHDKVLRSQLSHKEPASW